VAECLSPVFLRVELDGAGRAHLYLEAPAAAPTTRGFAAVLYTGLDGAEAAAVLAVPDDLPSRLGLDGLVSPLRLGGMTGLLRRVKRQIRDRLAEAT
jgi:cysteine desulfuration protein SufE